MAGLIAVLLAAWLLLAAGAPAGDEGTVARAVPSPAAGAGHPAAVTARGRGPPARRPAECPPIPAAPVPVPDPCCPPYRRRRARPTPTTDPPPGARPGDQSRSGSAKVLSSTHWW